MTGTPPPLHSALIELRPATSAAVPVSLAPPIFLAPMTPAEALSLGAAFSGIDPWVSYPYTPAALAAHFSAIEAGAPRYALRVGERVAGAVALRLNWLSGPYLQFLGLLPAFQGQGLGALVLNWFEADARNRGARNLWVAASDFNTGAIRFYERHGFVPLTAIENLVAEGRNELLLRKKL